MVVLSDLDGLVSSLILTLAQARPQVYDIVHVVLVGEYRVVVVGEVAQSRVKNKMFICLCSLVSCRVEVVVLDREFINLRVPRFVTDDEEFESHAQVIHVNVDILGQEIERVF